jgi:hypothetical protein
MFPMPAIIASGNASMRRVPAWRVAPSGRYDLHDDNDADEQRQPGECPHAGESFEGRHVFLQFPRAWGSFDGRQIPSECRHCVTSAANLCRICRNYPGAAAGRTLRSSHPAVSAFPERVVWSARTSSFSRLAWIHSRCGLHTRAGHCHGNRVWQSDWRPARLAA